MRHEPFDLEVGEGVVRGTLRAPGDEGVVPCVLITCDLPGSVDGRMDVVDDLTDALLAEGIACAHFTAREDDAPAAERASTVIDDAAAVFRWLLLRDDLDRGAIGVFGHGLGAIIAASLAGRTDQIARLCLLAPATGDDAVARLTKPNGLPPLLDANAVPDAFVTSLSNLTPATAVAVHDRATLIVQGAADRVIPPLTTEPYLEAIERAGHRVEHELVARADHVFSDDELRAVCLARIRQFFAGLKTAGSS